VLTVPRVTALELRRWRLASGGRDEDPIIGHLGEAGLRIWGWRYLARRRRRSPAATT
jgi:hypothetical protein